MASRRTRIKGIANIPQRRKNVNEECTGNQIKNEEKLEGNGNFTSGADTNETVQSSAITATRLLIDNIKSEFGNEDTSLSVAEDTSSHATETEATRVNTIKSDCSDNFNQHILQSNENIDAPLVRRKFLKPTVSNSVFNRKSRVTIEKQIILKPPSRVDYENNENVKTEDYYVAGCSEQVVINYLPENIIQIIETPRETEAESLKLVETSNLGNELTLEETHLVPQNKLNVKRDGYESIKKNVPPTSYTYNSDTEYPPLPPSPNKINRSRIKAIPRLGYRKTSFSASESEDESRRNFNRNRNDSVCSTASGVPESLIECMSPQRSREIIASNPKKCNRTEQSRKIAEARREFQRRFGTNKPDKQRLTMIDLIFYNPTTNPMMYNAKKEDGADVQINNTETKDNSEIIDDPQLEMEVDAEIANKSDEENEIPVPQIKIGPSGEIILDEKSLVIENKELQKQREEIQKTQLVDGDFDTGYGVYKKLKRSKDWTQSETLRFYKAIHTIGTDFTLMCDFFPRRTRRELKMKFKKEEKINKILIDKAVLQPCNFDFDQLKHEVDMEEKELQELEKQKEEEVKLKKEASERLAMKRKLNKEEKACRPPKIRKIRKPKIINNYKSIESILENDDADESDIATQSESEDELTLPPLPTRSGRIPKLTKKFDITEAMSVETVLRTNKVKNQPKCNDIEPGSIMIITEKGPNDEPIYKIYMVTTDKNATPLALTSDIVSKAIEFKKGVSAQNILTISANVTDDEGETEALPTENNITIPADQNITSLKEYNEKFEDLDFSNTSEKVIKHLQATANFSPILKEDEQNNERIE